jgi:phosphoribosyl 1,2-cyclic phosphodiesterase
MMNFIPYKSSSSGNLYEITDGTTRIMIDCGLPWGKVKKVIGYKTSEFAAVCLGHEHGDHSKGIRAAAVSGLDIYLMKETREALKLEGHRFHDIELKKTFDIGTVNVVAFPLQHDVPNCGFLFADRSGDKAVYINDSFYSKYKFKGVGIFAIGCNYSKDTMAEGLDPVRKKRLLTSHFSLENVLNFFEANDMSTVREIFLMHLSDENSDEEMFKTAIQAKTGKPVKICQK